MRKKIPKLEKETKRKAIVEVIINQKVEIAIKINLKLKKIIIWSIVVLKKDNQNIIAKDYLKLDIQRVKIKKDKLNDKSNDINQMNTINETLNTKCDILNEELDIKEKELSHLIGKYTRLAEKKEKILNNLIIKKREQNSITMRSQRNQNDICGITVEANEKGCGCEIGDFCFIF